MTCFCIPTSHSTALGKLKNVTSIIEAGGNQGIVLVTVSFVFCSDPRVPKGEVVENGVKFKFTVYQRN